ncbi:MAG: AAA family ATPase [Agathobacter sp.]|nr:AAA family ATPase [Agathobacter sp.]
MRLIECHIDNFGKLSNLNMQFGQGLNIIHEANAWGKSTLAAFLRVMFYGFDSKKESGSFDKERVVYRPWQGGTYGGELDFEYQGKRYRISRTFGKTEKADEFHLYDLSTNLECHDFSSEIGSELFGLDSASFRRSAFIAQNDCECGSTDAINAKLGNLVENTNDINNFESATKRIRDRMNKLSPDRATGSMKKRANMITHLEEELRSFLAAEVASMELGMKLTEKQEQKRELTEIRSQYAAALQLASEESRRESLKANYDSICREAAERQRVMDGYGKLFPVRVPEEVEFLQKNQEVQMLGILKTTLYNIGLTEEEKTQFHKLQDTFAEGIPEEAEIDEVDRKLDLLIHCRDERTQLETKMSYFEAMAITQEGELPERGKHRGMQVCAILSLVLGLGCFGVSVYAVLAKLLFLPWIIAGAAFIVSGISLLLVRRAKILSERKAILLARKQREEEHKKRQKPMEEIMALLERTGQQTQELRQEIMDFLKKYHIECEIKEAKSRLYELKNMLHEYDRMSRRLEKSAETGAECERTRKELLAFGEEIGVDFGDDIAAEISRMQTKAAEYRLAKSARDESLKKKAEFEASCDVNKLAVPQRCPYSLDELNQMIHDVDERLEDVRESIEQYNRQLEDLQEQLDLRDEKCQQMEEYKIDQESELHTYGVLTRTQDFLQRAKEQFSARYLGPIENGFQKYYEMLTGDTSGNWMVNANIAVQVKEQGELRDTKWLSVGYQDLLGVCMRLALVDAMYPSEKPFLLLDDPYVNLDEMKLQCGNQLLEKLSKEYQVIYFTCHQSRVVKTNG